jgi:hypothetical protein
MSLPKGLLTSWFSRLLSSLLSLLLYLISLSSIKSLLCFCLNLFVVILLYKGLVIELLGWGLLIIDVTRAFVVISKTPLKHSLRVVIITSINIILIIPLFNRLRDLLLPSLLSY